jgi:hypothetical protein
VSGTTPTTYTIRANLILINPYPTGTTNCIIIDGYRWPLVLSTDAQVTVIPDYWDEVIYLGALWRAQRDLGYRELSEHTKQNLAALTNEIRGFPVFSAMDTKPRTSPGIETDQEAMI